MDETELIFRALLTDSYACDPMIAASRQSATELDRRESRIEGEGLQGVAKHQEQVVE